MSMVRLDFTERVAWITLDRPPVNVLNIEMLRELDAVLDRVKQNKDASVAVIMGAGEKAFSAGVDVADHTPDKIEEMLKVFHGALRKIARLPQATVAAINGAALGGGLEVALVCDIVVASERSKVGQPEIALACFPPVAVAALPAICGKFAAADIVLTGERFGAEEARHLGLLSRVFPVEDFDESVRKLVSDMAARSPSVLRLTASLLRGHWLSHFETELDRAERTYLGDLAKEPDMAEGIAAFMEKRKPVWKT